MGKGYRMIRRVRNSSCVLDGQADRGGTIPSDQMTCLRQFGSTDSAMPITAVGKEIRLYGVIDRRDGGNEEYEQPYGAQDAGESKVFPRQA